MLAPVSYTHLDVYKRQVQGRVACGFGAVELRRVRRDPLLVRGGRRLGFQLLGFRGRYLHDAVATSGVWRRTVGQARRTSAGARMLPGSDERSPGSKASRFSAPAVARPICIEIPPRNLLSPADVGWRGMQRIGVEEADDRGRRVLIRRIDRRKRRRSDEGAASPAERTPPDPDRPLLRNSGTENSANCPILRPPFQRGVRHAERRRPGPVPARPVR